MMITLGGSPTAVPVPPMFENTTSAMSTGRGSRFNTWQSLQGGGQGSSLHQPHPSHMDIRWTSEERANSVPISYTCIALLSISDVIGIGSHTNTESFVQAIEFFILCHHHPPHTTLPTPPSPHHPPHPPHTTLPTPPSPHNPPHTTLPIHLIVANLIDTGVSSKIVVTLSYIGEG